MRHLSARLSWALLAAVIALLVAVGLVADHMTWVLANSERWVSHSHQVEKSIGAVRGTLLEADNARLRVVLLPGKLPAPDYAASEARLKSEVQNLNDLTRDNPDQQARLESLYPLIDRKFQLLNESVTLPQSPTSEPHQNQLSLDSLQVTNSLATLLDSMEEDESRLLRSREVVSDRTYVRVRIGIGVAFGVALILLLINFQQLLIELRNRQRAQESVRRLSARLLSLQDAERRKIARELHDSIGQYFVSLKMNFDMLRMQLPEGEREKILADCEELLDSGIGEARTLSHLLHPPLLDEAGFISAARWFVDGFTQRSKIVVTLIAPEDLIRLPKEVELTLFRALQESLTNIHRHSGSATAEIRLDAARNRVDLVVKDFGKGISPSLLDQFERSNTGTGVGLAGMRERIADLGGTLRLESDGPGGTTLRISIPLQPSGSKDVTSGHKPPGKENVLKPDTAKPENVGPPLLLADGIA